MRAFVQAPSNPRSTPSAPLLRGGPAVARLSPAGRAWPGAEAATDEPTLDSAHAIGWDHARHGLVPPLDRLCINPQLQQGYRAGRAAFGRSTQPAGAEVQRWLALRLRALAHGRAYESVQLTPHYLGQLAVEHCPVTREALSAGDGAAVTDADIERLREDAGYAAGHLAMLGRRAAAARGRRGYAELRALWRDAHRASAGAADAAANAAEPEGGAAPRSTRPEGLSAAAWGRLTILVSYVTPLEHDQAARLPMRVLPPNRLRLFNPVQALQALATRALAQDTPNRRLAALRAALPPLRRADFDGWLGAMHEQLAAELQARPGVPLRWALEDAWADARVLARWRRLARALSPAECEAAVSACGGMGVACLPDALATEGWALASGGWLRGRGRRGLRPAATESRQADPADAAADASAHGGTRNLWESAA